MIIGVPKEIKEQEQRVALLPSAVSQLTRQGHSVVVQKNAGIGSGYPDEEYVKAGAEIVDQAKEVFTRADMIVKVKEPLEAEFPLLRKGQILFTYLHLAASKSLTEALLKSGVTAGADVTILDIDVERLRFLDLAMENLHTLYSNEANLNDLMPDCDLLIGAVLLPGAKAPKLITRAMLQKMKRGSVFVDISIDQGGCAETSRPTTHLDPVYVEEGVTHYCVANMPAAYARTATQALTNVTYGYVELLADLGLEEACKKQPALIGGINTRDGRLTCRAVAEAHGLKYEPPL